MATITINGKTYQGKSVSVQNGVVYIDGKRADPETAPTINIEVNGNVDVLRVDACERVVVYGTCGSVQTASGDVECGDVKGPVQTVSGDVNCHAVSGSVSTMSGDVRKW